MSFWKRVQQHLRCGVAVPNQSPVTFLALAPQGLVLPGGLGLCRTHATPTVLPAGTPLSPPGLAAGLSSLSQGQVQNMLGRVQPPPTALQGYVQSRTTCRGQPAMVESQVGPSGICSFPCTSPSPMAGGCAPCPQGIAPPAPPAEGLLLSCREWWPGFPHPSAWGQQNTGQLSRYPSTP